MKKEFYSVPETELISFRLEKDFLIASGGAQSQGFTDAGSFDDGDWGIN